MLGNFLDWFVVKWLQKRGLDHQNDGFQFVVYSRDFIGSNINVYGIYEREYIEHILGIFHRLNVDSNLFIDVGANIGNHSASLGKYFEKVISVEPHPKNFELLSLNCSSKKYHLVNSAASSDEHIVNMTSFEHNMGGSKIIFGKSMEDDHNFTVKAVPLDQIVDEKDKVDVIKIDVEGHELDVLKGSLDIIRLSKPIIIFEQNSWEVKDSTETPADFLKKNGYNFTILRSNDPLNPGSRLEKIKRLISRVLDGPKITEIKNADISKFTTYPCIIAYPQS